MDQLELEDLVYTYPNINEPGFQTKISAKKEFKEVGALVSESIPKPGGLFRHQEFIKRFMRQYDEQLIFHQTGTGKTCSTIGVVEYYKKIAEELVETLSNDDIPYKKAVVLVKGDSLANEFKKQLLCVCTDGDYITEGILNFKSERSRKNNISRSISRFYTVTTYETFAKELFKMNDEQLHNEHENTIFIIDEVHNINKDTTQTKSKIDPTTGNKYFYKLETIGEKSDGLTREVIVTSRQTYDQLWRLFHLLHTRKIMALTATPMINDVFEIGPRLNLILPINKQLPDDQDYKTITLEEFEPYLRGRVSYVRQLDTGAIPIYRGKVLNATFDIDGTKEDAQMIIYSTKMSSKQLKTYKLAESDPKTLRPKKKKKKKKKKSDSDAFDDLKRQAANFVFPDGNTGTKGFRKYVIEEDNSFSANEELYKWISDFKRLQALSNKYATIINACKINEGNCWCYSNFIVGSGAVVLGLCFEAQGFENFNNSESVFSRTGSDINICGNKKEKESRKVNITKKLRYALLTSKTQPAERDVLLELFNSYENRYGEYIKVMIGSPVTRDGMNLANVLQIHLTGPGWNKASTYQAISRAIRSTSHVDLIEEKRERYLKEGRDPNLAKIDIDVYRHASIDENNTSIDIYMYERSERKDREIARVERILKQCSVDCQINYVRNVRATDINGSAICDYDTCAYKCVDPVSDYIDYTSYDNLYSQPIINQIKQDVKDIFRLVFVLTYNDIYTELSYRKKFIDLAVSEIIINKESIIDRYGTISYLREDMGTLFLRKDFPLGLIEKPGNLTLSEYTSSIMGISSISLKKYNGKTQSIEQNLIIENLVSLVNTPKFNETLNTLTLDNKIALLEASIYLYYFENISTDYTIAILEKFKPFIFSTKEPIASLDIAADALTNRGKGRGRKPKTGNKFKLNDKTEGEVLRVLNKTGNETVYFHNLSSAVESLTAYNVNSKTKNSDSKIRLIKSDGSSWRDANEYEDPVYNTIIMNNMINETKEIEKDFDLYGVVLFDGNFRIIDKTTEDITSSTDARKIHRGRICKSGWKKFNLIELLWKLDINPFKDKPIISRKKMEKYILNSIKTKNSIDNKIYKDKLNEMDDENIKFFYIWFSSGKGIKYMCETLQNNLQDMGRLFRK